MPATLPPLKSFPSAPNDDALTAASMADRSRSKWGSRFAMLATAYHLARQAWEYVERHQRDRVYTVTVIEHDEIYDLVQRWLLDRMPPDQQRSLMARTVSTRTGRVSSDEIPVQVGEPAPARRVVLHFDGTRSQRINLDGHQVTVRLEREDTNDASSTGSGGVYKPHKIVFEAPDLTAREAVVGFLQSVADSLADAKRTPRLVSSGRWGDWRVLRDLAPRDLDSVILPAGQLDALMTDLRQFLASERRYAELGVPWHRGYLFYGPPGTGKTTTARAVAHTLGLDVYYLPLGDIEKDTNLTNLIGEVPARCVLLLEDVDVFHAATARDDDHHGATLAGLLNALDGVVTPHGLITMMTTNDRDALDDALVRRGRVDMEIELTYLVQEQFVRLVERLTGSIDVRAYLAHVAGHPWPQLTAAEVVAAVTERMHDPALAAKACLALLEDRQCASPS